MVLGLASLEWFQWTLLFADIEQTILRWDFMQHHRLIMDPAGVAPSKLAQVNCIISAASLDLLALLDKFKDTI